MRCRQQADSQQPTAIRVPRALHRTLRSGPIHQPFLTLIDSNKNNINALCRDSHLHRKQTLKPSLWTRRRVEAPIAMTFPSALLRTSPIVRGSAKGPVKPSKSHPSSPLHLHDARIPSSHRPDQDHLHEAFHHFYRPERMNPNMHRKASDR
jgi:hypothetical protein